MTCLPHDVGQPGDSEVIDLAEALLLGFSLCSKEVEHWLGGVVTIPQTPLI
jgi:hypothetical protein